MDISVKHTKPPPFHRNHRAWIEASRVAGIPGPVHELRRWCHRHLRGPFRATRDHHLDPILIETDLEEDHMLVRLTWL